MRPLAFLVPGPLETRTGGYAYDRRMIAGLRRHGWSVEVHSLDAGFPHPSPAALRHAADVFAAIPGDTCVIVDGLALSAMPGIIEHESARVRIAALVHLPLAADVTLAADVAARFAADERRALNACALVVVTGTASLALLAGYGLPPERIVVVEPGTERSGRVAASAVGRPTDRLPEGGPNGPLELLCVATVHAGKGHALLVAALARLKHLEWELTCAGSLTRDPVTGNQVRTAVRDAGLEQRVAFVGELDEEQMGGLYDRADVFVLATWQETYGMAVAEALAHGLPVIATATGAIPSLVGTDAGILVPPGNVDALADALHRVIANAGLRAQLADGAARAAVRLPTWDQCARRLSDALASLESHG